MSEFERRRASVDERVRVLQSKLEEAERLVGARACVYVTGSVGRREATEHSDLDLFIVGVTRGEQRELSRLDEIRLMAQLIEVTEHCGFPPFSGDGEWLEHYTAAQLVAQLGRPNDDVTNTFTARMLLLLESRPLLGRAVYERAIDDVIAQYWRDYVGHKHEFVPAFLANDILRMWRTFCVNYEARTQTDPPEKKAKRKLKNYKLKHSRLLTCYSALAYLLAEFAAKRTVAPDAARNMVSITPTERIEQVAEMMPAAQQQASDVLKRYERFLVATNSPESDLLSRFLDPKQASELSSQAGELGDAMYELLTKVGNGTRLLRLLMV